MKNLDKRRTMLKIHKTQNPPRPKDMVLKNTIHVEVKNMLGFHRYKTKCRARGLNSIRPHE